MQPQARSHMLVTVDEENEVLVYDRANHRAHCLNRAAATLWRHCNGERDIPELAAILMRELGLPADQEVVRLGLSRLRRARLLEGHPDVELRAIRASRREVARRLGLTAAMMVLLPTITTVIAPTPAMAGPSCVTLTECTLGGEACNRPCCPPEVGTCRCTGGSAGRCRST